MTFFLPMRKLISLTDAGPVLGAAAAGWNTEAEGPPDELADDYECNLAGLFSDAFLAAFA